MLVKLKLVKKSFLAYLSFIGPFSGVDVVVVMVVVNYLDYGSSP
jgi:hypothetical protein